MIPPKFIYPSPDIPLRVLSYPCSVSGAPGKTYSPSAFQTLKCTSPPYPYPLPPSGLALPFSAWLLFSSSFSIDTSTVSWIQAVVKRFSRRWDSAKPGFSRTAGRGQPIAVFYPPSPFFTIHRSIMSAISSLFLSSKRKWVLP